MWSSGLAYMRWQRRVGLWWLLIVGTASANMDGAMLPITMFDDFLGLYQERFGEAHPCPSSLPDSFAVCAPSLRNPGNAARILHQHTAPTKIAVLVHGLSDSPFYLSAIAEQFHREGYTVILPLLPGHGQRQADVEMEDALLSQRWQQHVDDVMQLARQYEVPIVVGGFSTGGALVLDHYLRSPEGITGIALFSAALALADNAETLSKIWGVKWLAKLLDGDYNTEGENPFKYPSVSNYAALQLMDLIRAIRTRLDQGAKVQVPMFVAHSQADVTTPIRGVEYVMERTEASTMAFILSLEEKVCHADVVVSQDMYKTLISSPQWTDSPEPCTSSRPNPRFADIQSLLSKFLRFQLAF